MPYLHITESQTSTSRSEELQWYHKINWILHSVTFTLSILAFIVFWGLLYSSQGSSNLIGSVATHGFNMILLTIDLFFIAFPVRYLHFVYTFLLGLIYTIFTVIYWAAGRPDIYGIINWGEKVGLTLGYVLGLLFVGIPVFHALLFFGWKLISCCYNSRSLKSCCVSTTVQHEVIA